MVGTPLTAKQHHRNISSGYIADNQFYSFHNFFILGLNQQTTTHYEGHNPTQLPNYKGAGTYLLPPASGTYIYNQFIWG
ncbi:hypothetical protein [Algoriphagus sp. AGSA1]|uniref:hypothetical protein n=1 Tax=Algoriphagus sp. AGSA1 TaxID=2907213 RepID=UPI001F41640A|nr:hypothetical protein [Algoriphagus sp. AGSA1]